MRDERKLRVVQWSVGNIGRRSLRTVIEHPGLELVGVHVTTPGRIGSDAGELCGLAPTSIKATNSLDEIIALDADCVLYMRQGLDVNEVCRLLASGKNIVTTRGEFHYPPAMEADFRARVEAACQTGGTSIYSTGSSPGFISEALPIQLISLQRRFDGLTITEYGNMEMRDSPDLIFNVLGYGKTPEEFDTSHMHHLREMFTGTLAQLGDAIGLPAEDFTVGCEIALAKADEVVVAGPLRKGTVAAQKITVSALRGGKPYLNFVGLWFISRNVEADWDIRDIGWRVLVEGDAPMDIMIDYPIPKERYTEMTPGYTAHRAVNAVATVCAAAPGIRTTVDMAQVIAKFS